MTQLVELSNGVRILTDPMPELESAAIGVWVHAGTINETLEQHGAAHLLEHMAFKGTLRRSAHQIVEEIETVGGHLNASTSYLRTGYYARVLKNDAPLAMEILADILVNSTLDPQDLAKEQDVVLQEIGEAWDAPDDAVYEILQGLNYPDHPLGRPILGTVESVKAQTSEGLRAFMDDHYTADNLIISAAGGIDTDEIIQLTERYFSSFVCKSGVRPSVKPVYKGGAAHDMRNIEQTHVALSFPGVAATDDAFFAARIFSEALGGGMSSRLFQKVREQRGLAYSVYSFVDAYDDVGVVGTYVGADANAAAEAISVIRAEIADMADSATNIEVDRARALLKSTLLMGLESPLARIESAAAQLQSFGRVRSPAEIRERLDAVTLDDVRDSARLALSEPPSVAIVGPADFEQIRASASRPV